MSHFTVMVVTNGKDDLDSELEAILEPYSEHIEVEPYWDGEADRLEDFWAYRFLLEKGKVAEGATFEDVMKAYVAEYGEDADEKFRLTDDGKIERETTYNPKSKWDWYVLGGRWHGALTLKPEAAATAERPGGPSWGWTPEELAKVSPLAVNSARKADLDFEASRAAAATQATLTWDAYEAVLAGLPADVLQTTERWEDTRKRLRVEDAEDQETSRARMDVARQEYNDQPLIKALKDANLLGWMSGWEETFADKTRESFVQEARDGAVPCYAFLSEETGWIEPGKMGWWAIDTSTEASRREYNAKVNAIVDALPDNAVVSVVDCHI